MDHLRENFANVIEALSPRKKTIPKIHRSGSFRLFMRETEKLFEAKLPVGEEIDFSTLRPVRGLRQALYSKQYVMADSRDRPLRKVVVDLDEMKEKFGLEIDKMKKAFKIYMLMSSFLPEIYYAEIGASYLVLYMTHFE